MLGFGLGLLCLLGLFAIQTVLGWVTWQVSRWAAMAGGLAAHIGISTLDQWHRG